MTGCSRDCSREPADSDNAFHTQIMKGRWLCRLRDSCVEHGNTDAVGAAGEEEFRASSLRTARIEGENQRSRDRPADHVTPRQIRLGSNSIHCFRSARDRPASNSPDSSRSLNYLIIIRTHTDPRNGRASHCRSESARNLHTKESAIP